LNIPKPNVTTVAGYVVMLLVFGVITSKLIQHSALQNTFIAILTIVLLVALMVLTWIIGWVSGHERKK
jgi:hypothetical protein